MLTALDGSCHPTWTLWQAQCHPMLGFPCCRGIMKIATAACERPALQPGRVRCLTRTPDLQLGRHASEGLGLTVRGGGPHVPLAERWRHRLPDQLPVLVCGPSQQAGAPQELRTCMSWFPSHGRDMHSSRLLAPRIACTHDASLSTATAYMHATSSSYTESTCMSLSLLWNQGAQAALPQLLQWLHHRLTYASCMHCRAQEDTLTPAV